MRNKVKYVKYVAIILLALIFSTSVIAIGYCTEEPSHGRESTHTSHKGGYFNLGRAYCDSIVDVQGHMVFDSRQNGGYQKYAVFLNGELETTYGDDTSIKVRIYVTAYYEQEWMSMCSGNVYTSYFWGPPPINLVTWDGDMNYAATTPGVWQYTVGITVPVQQYSFSFSATYTSTAHCDKFPQVDPPIVEDIYRDMGYFKSKYSDDHEFRAGVYLHVHNDVAAQWASGVTWCDPPRAIITQRILSVRVKVIFEFSVLFWGWRGITSHPHIMGDGINQDNNDIDINSIPFVVGTC